MLAEAPVDLGSGITSDAPALWRQGSPMGDDDAAFRLALANGQSLQIIDHAIDGKENAVAVIPLGIDGFDRIEAVYRFLSALHGRAIPPDTRLTRQQRARQRRMLRAFDGYRAGATQQKSPRSFFASTISTVTLGRRLPSATPSRRSCAMPAP